MLPLKAGGLAWSVSNRGEDGGNLTDRCPDTLAVDAAQELFGGSKLRAQGHSAER